MSSDRSLIGTSHLYQRFAAIAASQPEKISVIETISRSTYGHVLERVHGLSTRLLQSGVKPGECVAVLLPNGSDFIVAAFAIWQCGAVLVPLHVRFQEDEIVRYTVDCKVGTVITHSRFGNLVQSLQARNSSLANFWLVASDTPDFQYAGPGRPPESNTVVPPAVAADWPALSQYSTGSTGFSKRITRTHRQLLGEFDTVSEMLEITAADRILGVAPFFHSYGLSNVVLGSQLSGATLYAVTDFFPKDVVKLIETEKLTGFPGVPFMYQLLAEQRGTSVLTSLRYALSAGAPLPAVTVRTFFANYRVGIRQLYGSTETGVIAIESRDSAPDREPTVGSTIPGVSVRLLDDANHAVRVGEEGQVAITSLYAATGYDNLASKSESYFAEGTFFPGDLGRFTAEGKLSLVGRKRQFINVAGNKVDPTEVENVLRECSVITEAVVLGVPDGAASEKIKAVLVTSKPTTRAEVLEYCKRLAEFKRPRVIEFRQEIPKSPLGKILRKYLIDEPKG